jgi:tRNA dimethylallyltransferase
MLKKPIIILGPTSVGKSRFALQLAQQINGEIISADSMQVYRYMDIGTAKPSAEERSVVPHHLIDIVDPDEEWTVSLFVQRAKEKIEEIKKMGKTPIVVGGTGLYLWSLINNFSFPIAPKDPVIREELAKDETSSLFERLNKIDPLSASRIHPNDKKRIIRALEVFLLTKRPISQIQKHGDDWEKYRLKGLNLPREALNKNIETRVDKMIENGLVDEVNNLLEMGFSPSLSSLQAIGYKEIIESLQGETSLNEAVNKIKKNTRNFAKRQMIWFRRFRNVAWFEAKQGFDKNIFCLYNNTS